MKDLTKELTIEQKAQRYDEAIEVARKIKNGEPIDVPDGTVIPVVIFPELEEPEEQEDEKIRKELIRAFQSLNTKVCNGIERTDIIDWLEKQGQTFTKKDVEIAYLKGVHDTKHELEKQESIEEIVSRCKASWYNEGKMHGKMEGLTDDEKYKQGWHDALEKQGEQKQEDDDIPSQVIDWEDEIEEITDQIVEWDDEDDAMLNKIIEDVEKLAGPYVCYYKDVNWLKSLKDRIQGKTQSEVIN